MIPSTLAGVVAFLIFVAPGVPWAEHVERHQSWRRIDGSFRQISRGAIWSTWFSVPSALLTILGLRLVAPGRLSALDRWLVQGQRPSGADVIVAVIAGFCELILAYGIMLLAWKTLSSKLYGPPSASTKSAWEEHIRKGEELARVFVSDGTSWFGQVAEFSTMNEWTAREIVLQDPVHVDSEGGSLWQASGKLVLPSAVITGVMIDTPEGESEDETLLELPPPVEGLE